MTDPHPTAIKAFRDQGMLEIAWPELGVRRIAFKTLRGNCPCAGCVDELTGIRTLNVDAIPADIAPARIELCGNYALKVEWNEGPNAKLSSADIWADLRGAIEKDGVVAKSEGDIAKGLASGEKFEASFELPFWTAALRLIAS